VGRRVVPIMKQCIQVLYIPKARMRAGMYYRLLVHPAIILVIFWARACPMVRGAALVALVNSAQLAW